MFENEKLLSLSDLIDIKLLQELQDTFASAMGVASISVDHKGIVTRASNFTEFCTKHTRGTQEGLKRCIDCDINWGKVAAERGEPVIYKCHAGLTDFAVPIIVEGRHIGSILGGQVLTEAPDEKHFRKVAKELGIDEDEYIVAVKKIQIVPYEKVEAAAKLLYIVANTISEIGHKNVQLHEKNRLEGLYRIIMGTINATHNVLETKKRIVNIIGQTLHADRCFIVEYDRSEGRFIEIQDEYLSSRSLKSYKNLDINEKCPIKTEFIKRGKMILYDAVKNKSKEIQMIISETPEIKADIGIPLHYGNQMLGVLVVNYETEDHIISDDEVKLLTSAAAQVSVVIYQDKLYRNLKKTSANQNAMLNNMPFMAWLKDENSKLLAVNEAFAKMCKTSVDNLIGKTDYDFFPKEYADIYVEEDKRVIQEKLTIQTVEPIGTAEGEPHWHETFKSPVFDENGNVIGTVGLSRDITEKIEADKILHKQQKELIKASEREKINRTIIDILRSTLDKGTIKHQFVRHLGIYLKANRVCISEFDPSTGDYLPFDKDSEYLSSPSEKSFVEYPWNTPETREFIEPLLNKKEVCIDDWDEYIAHNPKGDDFIHLFEDANIKSSYNFPILYQDRIMGFFCLEYTNKPYKMDDSDYLFIRGICRQVGVALYHAELYAKAQDRFSLSEVAVFNLIDKIKMPVNNLIKQSEIPSDTNSVTLTTAELKELNDQLKQLREIIKNV